MAVRLGIDAKIYYTPLLHTSTGAALSTPTPTTPWPSTLVPVDTANSSQSMLELSNCKNVTLNLEKSLADISTRATGGWKAEVAVLKTGSIDLTMLWDAADKGFSNLQHAFMNDKYIFLGVMDGNANTTTSGYRIQGLYSPFTVSNFTRNEALEDALTATVTLKPTNVTNYAPAWVDRTHS